MYGIIEQQEPAPPIEVDVTLIDFVNHTYTIDGVSYTAADIVDKPARVGVDGLEILDEDLDGVVLIIGPLLAALIPVHWTLVLEYFEDPIEYFIVPLIIQDEFGDKFIFIDRVDETSFEVFESSAGARSVVALADLSIPGIHRLAITRTQAHLAMSVDGGAVVSTDDAADDLESMLAAFGGFATGGVYSYGGCFIRSLSITAVVDDSELPGLSAL